MKTIKHQLTEEIGILKRNAEYLKKNPTNRAKIEQIADLLIQQADRLNRVKNQIYELALQQKMNISIPHRPIKLTVDLLLKLGFKKTVWKSEYSENKIPEYIIELGLGEIKITERMCKNHPFTFWFEDCNIKHIKYVHELQNLYYVLTNKELTLNF